MNTHVKDAVGQFMPFLPSDNNTLSDAEEIVQILNHDLAQLLRQPPAAFWSTVRTDRSLQTCIDSYLRYKLRSHDDGADSGVQGESAGSQQLAKRVFMVLMRMCGSQEHGRPGAPSPAEQASILYDRWLVDVPKLMDVCVLYGRANEQLTRQLVEQVFRLQPRYRDDVCGVVGPLVHNLERVAEACAAQVKRVTRGEHALARQVLDTMAYLRDTCITLTAFTSVYPPAAGLLLRPGPGDLLGSLAALHDRLLPVVAKMLLQESVLKACGLTVRQGVALVQQLTGGMQRLALQLLQLAFLAPPDQAMTGGSSASGHKAAEACGNDLMGSVLTAAHHGSSAAEHEGGGDAGSDSGGTLLAALASQHGLDSALGTAMAQGFIVLDDAQLDYLLALIGGDHAKVTAASRQQPAGPSGASAAAAPSGSSGAASASGSGAGAGGSGIKAMDPAVVASLISSVKEVMGPELGDGFVTACLHKWSYNAEQVIHHLLEGSLPPELDKLDRGLPTWSPPTAHDPKGKGKAVMGAAALEAPPPSSLPGGGSWAQLAAGARESAAASAAAQAAHAAATVPVPGASAPTRRAAMHRGVARVLGRVDDEVKQATRELADELQFEYDDEYDDSFDDLIATGADGVADVEGDDTNDRKRKGAASRFANYEDEPNDAAALPRQDRGPSFAARSDTGFGARPQPRSAHGAAAAAAGAAGGRQQQQQQGGAGGGRGHKDRTKLWVLDGRIYNYPKPGASEVSSREEADKMLQVQRDAAQAIHGLGAGGNKGIPNRLLQPQQPAEAAAHDDANEGAHGEVGRGQQQHGTGAGGRGGSGGRGGGRGGGQPNFARKEQNKAAVGNHHRKDRAFRKMGLA